jgi:hypothetical protein
MTIGFESTEIKEERWSPDMEPAQEKEGGPTVGEIKTAPRALQALG